MKISALTLILTGTMASPTLAQSPLEEQLRRMEADLQRQELQQLVRQDALVVVEVEMAEMARQFPVPPVPPVPPRDARDEMREKLRQPRRRVPDGWVESTEPFTRAFKVGKAAALMVANISGNIQVSPGSSDQIEVQALKRAWGPNAEQAKLRLGDATIEAFASGNRVELRVEHGTRTRRDGRGIDIEFDIKVPGDTSVELRTVSGGIRVTNVKGEVRVQGISSNLALEGTPRLAAVKTVSGDITLTNAGADTQLSASTVSGDLLMQTLSAKSIDLNTISGDVRVSGWSGDRALIRSLSGNLDLQGSLARGGRYEIESHSGDVQISLPDQPGFEIDAQTFSGRVRVDFAIKSEGPIRENDRGPRSIRGTYGDGSSSLRIQTFSGNLTVTRR